MQIVYALLCLIGIALPLAPMMPWLGNYGLDLPLLIQQARATPVSMFAWADVLVSAGVVVALVLAEGRRLNMRHAWLAVPGLVIGVSLALPLFLLMRERHLSRTAAQRG